MLSGCTDETSSTITGDKAFIGGKVGLTMEFLSGAPPEEVFDSNNPFSIDIKLENEGEWGVNMNDTTIKITGIYPSDFGLLTSEDLIKHPDEDMTAAQRDPQGNTIQGTITDIEFEGLEYNREIAGFVQFNIKAENCFEYGTTAQSQLCIKEDLLGKTGEEGTCDPNGEKTMDNSGAPIHVTKLSESVAGKDKISFVFNVEHIGDGKVYKMDTSCSTDFNDRNKVFITVNDPGIGALSCSGLEGGSTSGYATLFDDERSIRCTINLDEASLGDYEKVLNVVIEYGYKESIETPLIVKHSE
ncbi:hypothetical protein HQ529_03000 [Candidatus Woesearchaeota archaeon]|nr:hypothetical protein [Candidatus Woesearchaeota archaeon]